MKNTDASKRISSSNDGAGNVASGFRASEQPDRSWLAEMIATAAYFRAERRGFAPGNELADWLQAEAEFANCSTLNAN